MSFKLIIALDFDTESRAFDLIDALDPKQCALKIGHEMFTRFGPQFVRQMVTRGFKVFLDLKFHDIPNTVARACKAAADLGVWMLNVHAIGGEKMMVAAREAIVPYDKSRPLLIAVTVLTSFNAFDLKSIGLSRDLDHQVIHLATLANHAGLDGVVCSAQEVQLIKQACGISFLTVTPGIRLAHDSRDDQSRIMTPQQAINEGSDYLVLGRSITQSDHPIDAVNQILKSI